MERRSGGEEKGRGEVEERRSGGRSGGEKEKREGEGAGGIQNLESRPTILWRMGKTCATELSFLFFFDFAEKILLLAITFFSFRILKI